MNSNILLIAASLLGLGQAANLTYTVGADSVLGLYKQLGNSVTCIEDAAANPDLKASGGTMDFTSDSLEMCARACLCRQGCVSFNYNKPTGFNGTTTFALDTDATGFGDQGKCNLFASNCSGANSDVSIDSDKYAFEKIDQTATDVAADYPRNSASGELEVVDQVKCLIERDNTSDWVQLGSGGPGAGVCASGGSSAKITALDDQAPANTGETACLTMCDGDSTCKMINLLTDGSCKFRSQRCQTFYDSGGAKEGWTTYIKQTAIDLGATDQDDQVYIDDTTDGPTDFSAGEAGPTDFSAGEAVSLSLLLSHLFLLELVLM